MLLSILLISIFHHTTLSQYEVVRRDPFRYVSPSLLIHSDTALDWDSLNLSCPPGTKISIQTVEYSSLSPGRNSSSCRSPEPVRRVEAECQGREECSLVVTPHNLITHSTEPGHCQDLIRQLSVSHQCRPSSLRTRLTCPASSLELSCLERERTRLFVMVSSESRDKESLLHYCGLQEARSGLSEDHLTNSSLTSLVVGACHGLTHCHLSLPSANLLRTVYSCVSPGVINMDLVQRQKTTTAASTTTTTTTTSTTKTTTVGTSEVPTTSTKISSIHLTSFQSFIRTKDQENVNESFQNDQIQTKVEGHTTDNKAGAAAKGSLISDISDVSQYRVISEDMNLDILPLEQDISNSASTEGTFIQKEFGTLLVLSCCTVMTVVLVSVILVITVRVLHRANIGSGESDSTYSPASESVETEGYSQDTLNTSYSPGSERVYQLDLYNSRLSSSAAPQIHFNESRNSQIYGTVGRKIKPRTIVDTEEHRAYQSNYF